MFFITHSVYFLIGQFSIAVICLSPIFGWIFTTVYGCPILAYHSTPSMHPICHCVPVSTYLTSLTIHHIFKPTVCSCAILHFYPARSSPVSSMCPTYRCPWFWVPDYSAPSSAQHHSISAVSYLTLIYRCWAYSAVSNSLVWCSWVAHLVVHFIATFICSIFINFPLIRYSYAMPIWHAWYSKFAISHPLFP